MPRIFIQCENARRMETFPSSGDSRPDGLFVEPTPEKPNRAGIPAVVTNLGEEPVAGLGRLQRYQALKDGRYLLMILGEKRVRVIQRIEDQDYPLAEVDDLVEEDVDIDWEQAEELKNAIGELEHNIDLPEGTSAVQMSDLLIMITPMTVENRYELFSNPSIEDRVVKIIELQDSIRGDEPFD